ncbi:MAG: discoidin domain-containing protein, partial [Blastocatellia bacterium]
MLVIAWGLSPAASAQNSGLSIPVNISQTSLPVTIGVPIQESFNIRDSASLTITDPAGNSLPTQIRVLARWRGTANDADKPVKWALVDFQPRTTGKHALTLAPSVSPTSSLLVSSSSDIVRITSNRLSLELSGKGSGLINSFRLDGTEQLRAPMQLQASAPRGGIVVRVPASTDSLYLNDSGQLRAGDTVRFIHTTRLLWDAPAGTSQLVADDQNLLAGHRYLIDEGTAQQEEVLVRTAANGTLTTETTLKFKHTAGAVVRDLSVEEESGVIKSIAGQLITFSNALKKTHALNDKVLPATDPLTSAIAYIERASVEENGALRTVIRQDGFFTNAVNASARVLGDVRFTIRYYIYAGQPFVRVRLRLINEGAYGFGADRTLEPPFARHMLFRSLSVLVPALSGGAADISVLTAAESHARVAENRNSASIGATGLELAVPEFAENFPKKLAGTASGFRFDLLPDLGIDHLFEGARAKTTDFYLGKQTRDALNLTSRATATLDPAYVARSGAVRPVMIERREWKNTFPQDAEMREAADLTERMFAVAYAPESAEGNNYQPPQSVLEYRLRGEYGEHFGWQNFGDLAWGDGYSNLHYDLSWHILREFLRTADPRAFRIGSEMAMYRSDWGQCHANDYLDSTRTLDMHGMSFYEKGRHGSYREPVFSHHWVEGLWLYWALTGDESVHVSAIEASESISRYGFTYDNALSWNETRMAGWPALAMVAAWRYSGELKYLTKARDLTYLLVQVEEDAGRKGYFIAPGSGFGHVTQPLMWSGYSQYGVIEFWRETNDPRVAAFLVRVADWVAGRDEKYKVLLGGVTLADGSYDPLGSPYFWDPDKPGENDTLVQAMLSLPVLSVGARISKRPELLAMARMLYRDTAFYRDYPHNTRLLATGRAQINFRSAMFGASCSKIYGHTGFALGDYQAELHNAITLPHSAPALPAPTPLPTPTVITPSPARPVSCLRQMAFAGLGNVALNRPATASSLHMWPNATNVPTTANDGLMAMSDGRVSLWHSESNTKQREWWQVDLQQEVRIAGVEILFRTENNQTNTRRNFEVRASNDPAFASSVLLGRQGAEPHPFQRPWQINVTD